MKKDQAKKAIFINVQEQSRNFIGTELEPSIREELIKKNQKVTQDLVESELRNAMRDNSVINLVREMTLATLKEQITSKVEAKYEKNYSSLQAKYSKLIVANLKLSTSPEYNYSEKEITDKVNLLINQSKNREISNYMKPFIKIANADRDVSDPGFFAEKNLGKRRRPFADCNANMMPPPKLPRTG